MILLIDNYDSFVNNLARYFQRLGQETVVVRNDEATVDSVRNMAPKAIVISPGPCTPAEAGQCTRIVRRLHRRVPILGVCLGHQAIAAALGARITTAPEPMHGRTSLVEHTGAGVFEGLPNPLTVCRYHSLVVDERTLPGDFNVTARTESGVVMAIEHVAKPVVGVQFHPEAALTEHGYALLANFLRLAGCEPTADSAALAASEIRMPPAPPFAPPKRPLTF
jgi:anthranilate synthase/aminodeoxychorismate synthase-like glutamine amidotransferase